MLDDRVPVVSRIFSSLYSFQTGSGAYPASYPMGTGGSFPGIKRLGVKQTIHLVKKTWIYTSTPPYVFKA
jgi:hypothetical protein